MEKSYKDTLNLPQTNMPMRAGLAQKELEILEKWTEMDIYHKVLEKNKKNPSYILHDGPPYPNGNIHLGHALNKTLKDIVIKYQALTGHFAPYIPGWDCHGLPIETQLQKELKKNNQEAKKSDIHWFREECKRYALAYVETQKAQFKRLGIFGDFDNPYLTLNPLYESKIVELFGSMAEKGLVYKGMKPIHWCASCTTALAEAEIEYANKKSASVYVRFAINQHAGKTVFREKTSIVVWTTTPWTLPANVAVAVHPTLDYDLVSIDNGKEYLIVCTQLTHQVMAKIGIDNFSVTHTVKGTDLAELTYSHPFMNRTSPIVTANYVSHEDGSGAVHIAPGHGQEDYIVGQQYQLPIIMPVDAQGVFTAEAGVFEGQKIWDANKSIVQAMEDNQSLLKMEWIEHAYPHCWRCHNPVIFRATEQWFIAMDNEVMLRQHVLNEIKKVRWVPAGGEKRITSMVAGRPDWCISRQRSWGVPIPVFYCSSCREPHMTGTFNTAIVQLFAAEGSNAWFVKTAQEILPKGTICVKCGHSDFDKETDIMDVWLESGASHHAVLNTYPELSYPADLYLEGSDQHRGWFQSSLLTAVGQKGIAPYKAVLTHGFLIDDVGAKMSKSKGNVIDPSSITAEYGADILRLWVVTEDFKNDLSISEPLLKQIQTGYIKIRNTLRYLLSNCYDFDPRQHMLEFSQLKLVDQWMLTRLHRLLEKVTIAYNDFEFHTIYHTVQNFCTVDLSAIYMDIHKDNLYCNGQNSLERRSTQTVMYECAKSLMMVLAPILSYTAEDVYSFMPGIQKESVFLELFPQANPAYFNVELEAKFETLLAIRDAINVQLEALRNQKIIGSSLDAKVTVFCPGDVSVADVFSVITVSEVTIQKALQLSVVASKADGEKCERCWKYGKLINGLCSRCAGVVSKG